MLHISDLHFGRINPEAVQALQSFIIESPKAFDLIILTGDLTQRARKAQFLEALEFLKDLPCPVVAVPGNHDMPLYHLLKRAWKPLKYFKRYIEPVTLQVFEDEALLVAGFHSQAVFRFVEGKFRGGEVRKLKEIFAPKEKRKIKIIATHHPIFNAPHAKSEKQRRRRSEVLALEPDMILSGHTHKILVEKLKTPEGEPSPWLISSGTSLSDRTREETNSFHVIETDYPHVEIKTYHLSEKIFSEKSKQVFDLK